MDSSKLENDLISEIKLTPIQAKTFLLVTWFWENVCYPNCRKIKISSTTAEKLPLIL